MRPPFLLDSCGSLDFPVADGEQGDGAQQARPGQTHFLSHERQAGVRGAFVASGQRRGPGPA